MWKQTRFESLVSYVEGHQGMRAMVFEGLVGVWYSDENTNERYVGKVSSKREFDDLLQSILASL